MEHLKAWHGFCGTCRTKRLSSESTDVELPTLPCERTCKGCKGRQDIFWACPSTPLRFSDIENLLASKGKFSHIQACECDRDFLYRSHSSWWTISEDNDLELNTSIPLGAFPDWESGPSAPQVDYAFQAYGDVQICPHLKLSDQILPFQSRKCPFLCPGLGTMRCPCHNKCHWEDLSCSPLVCPTENCKTEVQFFMEKGLKDYGRLPQLNMMVQRTLGSLPLRDSIPSDPTWRSQLTPSQHLENQKMVFFKHWANGKRWVELSSAIKERRFREWEAEHRGIRRNTAFEWENGSNLNIQGMQKELVKYHPRYLIREKASIGGEPTIWNVRGEEGPCRRLEVKENKAAELDFYLAEWPCAGLEFAADIEALSGESEPPAVSEDQASLYRYASSSRSTHCLIQSDKSADMLFSSAFGKRTESGQSNWPAPDMAPKNFYLRFKLFVRILMEKAHLRGSGHDTKDFEPEIREKAKK